VNANPQTEEQRRLGQKCVLHADMVQAMLSGGDVTGAFDYLSDVQANDGRQMCKNVTDLLSLRLAILPPEMR
jgi:hypothetical protein